MGRLGNLRGRLRKAEREAEGLWQVLTLSDGTKVKYAPEALLDALFAALEGEEHHLLPCIERMDPNKGIPSLVRALGHPAEGNLEEENDGN